MSRLARAYGIACTVFFTVAALMACSPDVRNVFFATVGADSTLRIGVKIDQPGLGLRAADGTLRGFDVDVARYVAADLGVPASAITFVEAQSSDREAMLERGDVDLIVATYSMTPERAQRVDFAGPYFVAGQSLLVRRQNSDIAGPQSLDHHDWRLCGVRGSTGAARIRDDFAGQVSLIEFGTYSLCVDALHRGEVDAVTSDDVILAGYAAQEPARLKVVGAPFSVEEYGIGLRKGDRRVDKVNQSLRKMIESGSWRQFAERNLGHSGYRIPDPPSVRH